MMSFFSMLETRASFEFAEQRQDIEGADEGVELNNLVPSRAGRYGKNRIFGRENARTKNSFWLFYFSQRTVSRPFGDSATPELRHRSRGQATNST